MTDPARPAGFAPTGLVWSATLLLPHGVSRDRYRQEFAAEMYGRPRIRQLAYALGVCAHLWSLRTVLVHGTEVARVPFLCRTGLHHHWSEHANDGGRPFTTCSRCGRERGGPAGTSINSLFLPMSAGRPDH